MQKVANFISLEVKLKAEQKTKFLEAQKKRNLTNG
jgi:hypothetical protein